MSTSSSTSRPAHAHGSGGKSHAPGAKNNSSTGPYTSSTYQRHSDHRPQPNTSTSTTTTTNQNPTNLPKNAPDAEQVYILTLLTSTAHHETMTGLRTKYFPRHLNKLASHITLFHALPATHLEQITHDLTTLASRTSPFTITATTPFRMARGVGITVPPAKGGDQARAVFVELQRMWHPWLSRQDRGASFRPHYTIMNKVDDQAAVDSAMHEVKTEFPGSEGRVNGLSLFRYDRGWWRGEREFLFREVPPGGSDGG